MDFHFFKFQKKILESSSNVKGLQRKIDVFNEAFNATMKKSEGILTLKEPRIYSMNEESNIASKYSSKYIATKDGNLCAGFRLEGISYCAASLEQEIELVKSRNRFWSKLDSSVEINIFCKKEKIQIQTNSKVSNQYIQEIIQKYEEGIVAYGIYYYMFISTKS